MVRQGLVCEGGGGEPEPEARVRAGEHDVTLMSVSSVESWPDHCDVSVLNVELAWSLLCQCPQCESWPAHVLTVWVSGDD